MKFRILNTMTLAFGIFLSSTGQAEADTWVKIAPEPNSVCPATGCAVEWVQWDVRTGSYPGATNAVLSFSLLEGSTHQRYHYYYNSGDASSLGKANQLFTTILTAKSMGSGVVVAYQDPILSNCVSGDRCPTVIQIP